MARVNDWFICFRVLYCTYLIYNKYLITRDYFQFCIQRHRGPHESNVTIKNKSLYLIKQNPKFQCDTYSIVATAISLKVVRTKSNKIEPNREHFRANNSKKFACQLSHLLPEDQKEARVNWCQKIRACTTSSVVMIRGFTIMNRMNSYGIYDQMNSYGPTVCLGVSM